MAEQPLPLFYVDDDGKFVVGEEAAQIISKVRGKIGVIAIAGLYRTGKSYILNRLLGRQHGFEIGGTINSCTKGIYTWGKPLKVVNENGEELHIILMDTEGIGSFERNQTHDAKIFSLSVLLSSYFIYNSMGVIDEGALEKISFIANLTKHIHVHSPSGRNEEEDERELAPYFPQFMWLLRDFGLKLVDTDGTPITSRQYLENALSRPSKDKSKNQIRQVITTVFPYRDCVTLVRPVVDEEDLQNLDKIPEESLRDKFRTDVSVFTQNIIKKVRPKMLFGQPINGPAFLSLVRSYVEAINTGAVPTIRTAWESATELENKKAVEAAVEIYHKLLDAKAAEFPIEQADLYSEHLASVAKSKEEFSMRALGEQKEEYVVQLEAKLTDEYEKFVQKNDAASEKSCKELFNKIYDNIGTSLKSESFSTCTELSQRWKQLIDSEYLPNARGKFKYSVLSENLLSRMSDSLVILDQELQEKLRAQHTEERNLLREEIKEEKEEKRKLREEYEDSRNDWKSQQEKNDSHIKALQEANDTQKKQISDLISERDKIAKELNELKSKIQAPPRSQAKTTPETPQLERSGKKDKKGCVVQ